MQGRAAAISGEDGPGLARTGFFTIRKKLLLYFILSAFLGSVALGGLAIRQATGALLDRTEELFLSIASHKVSQLRLWLEDSRTRVRSFADTSTVFLEGAGGLMAAPDGEDRKTVIASMEEFLYHNPVFFELFLMDPASGRVFLSTEPSSEGVDQSGRDFFMEGLGDTFSTGIYYSPSLHTSAITISTPVRRKAGGLLAVLAARVNLFSLNDILAERSGLGKTGETYIVSNNNSIVAGAGFTEEHQMSASELKHKTIRTAGALNALADKKGFAAYMGYDIYEVTGYYEYLPFFDAALLVEQHTHETLEPVRALTIRIGLYILAILAFMVVMANMVAGTFSRPIVHLAEGASRIASGQLKHSVRVDTSDEIGILAIAFNRMTEHLVSSLDETKNIIETMPDALFILDRDGKIRSANHTTSLLVGVGRHRLVGQPFDRLVLRQDILWGDIIKKINSKAFTDLQVFCHTKGGAKIPVSLSGSPMKNKHGKTTGFLIIAKDLRELKKYAKKRLDGITPVLQSISLGDFTKRPELPPSEDEFTDLIVAVDLMADNLGALIKESQKKTDQIEFSKNKLEAAHHKLKKALTAIEKEKVKADTLLASLGEGVMAIDLRGNIMILNHEAEKMFGHPASKTLGKPYMEFFEFKNEKGKIITPDEYPISAVASHKKTVFTTTYFVRKGAEPLPLATTVSPILFAGKLFGIVATFRDVTREMEIDRAKTEFVSLASHQLRTPLTAVKWLLQELLRKGDLSKIQHEYAGDALKSNDRMVSLVNDLLNVSRLEAGKVGVLSKKVNVTDIIGQIINEANAELREKNIKIHFVRPASPVSIEVDSQLFRQVVSNLLSNAIKYSNPGTTVTIRLAKKAGKVQIEVEDQGIGIPKNQQHRLFEKFFRTDEAAKRSTTGSGLGLYIAKKIMNACHGSIRCASRENRGTKFTIIFPVRGPVVKKEEKQLIPHKIS